MENIDPNLNPTDELTQLEYAEPAPTNDSVAEAHEGAPTTTNADIDFTVMRCLRCVVERHADNYTNIAIAGVAVGQCLDMSPHRAIASLKRISYSDQPPIVRARRALPFRLTAEACQLTAGPTPNNCQKIGPDMVVTRPQPAPRPSAQEKVISECTKNIPDTDDQARAAKELQSLIDRKIVEVKRTRVSNMPAVHGYPDRGSWVHLGIGKALTSEIESVQRATLHYLGIDTLIYGERLDPAVLREKLCLLPLDELSALAKLTLYRIDRRNTKLATNRR